LIDRHNLRFIVQCLRILQVGKNAFKAVDISLQFLPFHSHVGYNHTTSHPLNREKQVGL